MIRIYTDTAVNGNPGRAGVGILILKGEDQIQLTTPLSGMWDNHEAEFKAMLDGLTWLVQNDSASELTLGYTDSQIVAQSIEKKYVKDRTFQKYLTEILKLMEEFPYISISWLPESENRGADNLARQALQKALKDQK
jgi:ribonuclease HI